MALKIRLSRIGSTHQPHYRIVVAETRSRRDGDAVETLGTYDPRTKGQQVKVKLDRVDYWISKGAKPTDTLHSIIKRARRGVSLAPAPAPAAAAAAAPESTPAAAPASTPAAAPESAPATAS
jgi:small subunit ribosomal protein S16